jgi:catechol 2,3-dioxygenase-like lactoylglutathione lyase family enzyme
MADAQGHGAADPEAARKRRRAATAYSNYFHRAVRVRDMEATRHFYEDLVGLPMVACAVMDTAHGTGEATNYIHTFFELSDGSYLAFFQFADDRYPYIERAGSYFDHHAISAKSEQTVLDMVAKAKELGIFHLDVDDASCHSVYIRDPDDDLFEIAYQRPGSIDALEDGDAHEKLRNWLASYGDKQRVVPRPKRSAST